MSGEQVELVDDGMTGAELREAEYGGTPIPLIRQALVHLRSGLLRRSVVKSFVEPGSGPAPFCRVVGAMWPDSIRYAVDVRETERQHASRNATCFVAGAFESFASMDEHAHVRPFDLLATNPPFSAAFDWAERGVELARDVLLLLPDDWHKRTKDRVARFVDGGLRECVVGQMQIPGRIAFYGGSRTDRVSYSWWHFSKVGKYGAPASGCGFWGSWPTWLLPMLPAWARRWQGCRPGEGL